MRQAWKTVEDAVNRPIGNANRITLGTMARGALFGFVVLLAACTQGPGGGGIGLGSGQDPDPATVDFPIFYIRHQVPEDQDDVTRHRPFVEDEEANEAVFILKTQYAPAIFDGRNRPAKGVQIGGGSVIRLLGNIVPYDKGVTMQFNQVQVKELNGFGTSGFGEVDDGYEYDEADASFQTDAQQAADTDDNGGASNGSALDI